MTAEEISPSSAALEEEIQIIASILGEDVVITFNPPSIEFEITVRVYNVKILLRGLITDDSRIDYSSLRITCKDVSHKYTDSFLTQVVTTLKRNLIDSENIYLAYLSAVELLQSQSAIPLETEEDHPNAEMRTAYLPCTNGTCILHLDHMNDENYYVKNLSNHCADLDLVVLLFLSVSKKHIVVLIESSEDLHIDIFLDRWRSSMCDKDIKGRPCKERKSEMISRFQRQEVMHLSSHAGVVRIPCKSGKYDAPKLLRSAPFGDEQSATAIEDFFR